MQRLRRLDSSRRARWEERRFVVEGAHPVAEALSAGATIEAVYIDPESASQAHQGLVGRCRAAGVTVLEVQPGVLARVCQAVTPQPIAAVVAMPEATVGQLDFEAGPVVVCVGLQDPGNAGGIARSAWASGACGLVLCGGSVDIFNPKAVRASAGAVFWLPVVSVGDPGPVLEILRERGVRTLAALPRGGQDYLEADLTGPTALVFGGEAAGLRDGVADHLDGAVTISMAGQTESLNVAMAAAVVCFEARRQRHLAPPAETRAGSDGGAGLIATISHELRSPLVSINGFSALMLDRWDRVPEPEKLMMLSQIHHDAGRVSRLMAELLDISRLESGRLSVSTGPADLEALAQVAVDSTRLQYPELDAEVVFPADLPRASGDPDRIVQVLANLLENACKYASPKGLKIEGAVAEGEVSVTVTDRGEGIPEVELPRIFEKYFRSSLAQPSGSGLGLWISRGLIEAQGGRLTVQSNAGQGSSFRFTLPILESDQISPS